MKYILSVIAVVVIAVNYADRKLTEPMVATPSVKVSKYARVVKGMLVEVTH